MKGLKQFIQESLINESLYISIHATDDKNSKSILNTQSYVIWNLLAKINKYASREYLYGSKQPVKVSKEDLEKLFNRLDNKRTVGIMRGKSDYKRYENDFIESFKKKKDELLDAADKNGGYVYWYIGY